MMHCKELEDFIENSEHWAGDSVINWKPNGKYYIVKSLYVVPDGDGRVDTWVDKQEQIIYCPFCGKRL